MVSKKRIERLTVTGRDDYTPTVRGGGVLTFIMAGSMLIGSDMSVVFLVPKKSIRGLKNVFPVIFRFILGEISVERKIFRPFS